MKISDWPLLSDELWFVVVSGMPGKTEVLELEAHNKLSSRDSANLKTEILNLK